MYNLVKQSMVSISIHHTCPRNFSRAHSFVHSQHQVSNLIGGFKQLSCMSVHPSGDHVIIGSHDRRLSWCELLQHRSSLC